MRNTNRRLQGILGAAAALLIVILGLSPAPAYSQFTCTATAGNAIWNISGSGNWDVPGNWNPSTAVPDSPTTSVCILNSAPTTVTLNTFQLANMDNLTVNSADTISVSGLEVGLNVFGTSIQNAGNIDFTGGNDLSSGLALGNNGNVTLNGGGTINLSTAPGGAAFVFAIDHTTPTLTNVDNTLQGNGVIGQGPSTGILTLVNDTKGTIDATTATGQIATLTLNPAGGVTNQGLLEATTGTLIIQSTTVVNGGGNITANGGTVQLLNATIQGGTLTNNGGTFESAHAAGATLDGSTSAGAVTINGTYIDNSEHSSTDINGTIVNKGTIYVNGTGEFFTPLDIGAPGATVNSVTLEGGGTVTLFSTSTPFAGPAVIGAVSSAAPLENVNNTIQGNGIIAGITLINDSGGTIDATTGSGQQSTLTLEPASITNAGLMEASSGAELVLATPVNNTGGNITANGGVVVVENAITGGTLNTTNGGVMETQPGANAGAVLNGVTISQGSTYTGPAGISNTTLQGTITNNGTIALTGAFEATATLGIGSATMPNVTLQGGGTITMASLNIGGSTIAGAFQVSGATLTNVNNTIQGNGAIGALTLVNQTNGVVDATTTTGEINTLLLGGTVTNQGLLEATTGILQIQAPVNNTGGVIAAEGGTVEVSNTITAGTLITTLGGTMETVGEATLDGSNTSDGAVTIFPGSTYTTPGGAVTILKGTINNIGTILVSGLNGGNALLEAGSKPMLEGGGTVVLASTVASGEAIIGTTGTITTLTNVDNTIEGNGIIGFNGLALTNEGTVEATSASGQLPTLTINGGSVKNIGTLAAVAGNILHLTGGAKLKNFSSGTLTSGIYDANGTIQVDSLGSTGGEIVTNNAFITLDGSNGGSALISDAAGKNALSKLATNEGVFTVENGGNADFTIAGNLANSDTVFVGAGTKLTIGTGGASSYTQSGGLTKVNGTLTGSTVAINGGLLDGTGTVTGAVTVGPNGMIQPGDAPGTITFNGSLALTGTLNEEIDSPTSFDVTDIIGTPGTATLGGTLDISLPDGFGFLTSGEQFIVLDATGGLGGTTFPTVVGLHFGSGDSFSVGYSTDDVTLTANIPISVTPEPASLALLGIGLLGLGWAIRRHSKASAGL